MGAKVLMISLVEGCASDAILLQESLSHLSTGEFQFTHVQSWGEAAAEESERAQAS
jgi:hypothetical protein